jgi:hypothetical protein
MAEDKKSFVLYADLIHTVEKMPDDKAGVLLKIILSYVNDRNPTVEDMVVDLVFEPIKRQMKRDLKKYEEKKKARSEAGKVSAETKRILKEFEENQQNSTNVNKIQQSSTNDNNGQQTSTNSTGNVNDTDTVTVTVNGTGNVNGIINTDFPKFPNEENLQLEIPEIKIGAVKELLKIGKQITVDDEKVLRYWKVFKVQNFNGKKFYEDVSDTYTHFINWMNRQTPTTLKTFNSYSAPEEISDREKKEKLKKQLSTYD